MAKEKKNYRLEKEALENIKYIQNLYQVVNGVKISEAQAIEMAVHDYAMNLAMKLNMEHEAEYESYREERMKALEAEFDV